jgi:hypothetical protein
MLLRIFLATLATTVTFLSMAACATQPADLDLSLTRESVSGAHHVTPEPWAEHRGPRSTVNLNDGFAAGI